MSDVIRTGAGRDAEHTSQTHGGNGGVENRQPAGAIPQAVQSRPAAGVGLEVCNDRDERYRDLEERIARLEKTVNGLIMQLRRYYKALATIE